MPKRLTTKRLLSLRAYAKRRRVSVEAVSKAITSGRLRQSIVFVKRRPKIANAALADREWTANTDLSKAPASVKERDGESGAPDSSPRPMSALTAASVREKDARVRLAELDYQRKAGELVNAKEAEARMTDVFTRCRTKLLAIPTKAKATLPHLTAADVLTLDGLVREALEELATLPVDHGAAA